MMQPFPYVVFYSLIFCRYDQFLCYFAAASEFEGILQTYSGMASYIGFVDRLLVRFFGNASGVETDGGNIQYTERDVRFVFLTWDTFCGELMRRMPQNGEKGSPAQHMSPIVRMANVSLLRGEV